MIGSQEDANDLEFADAFVGPCFNAPLFGGLDDAEGSGIDNYMD